MDSLITSLDLFDKINQLAFDSSVDIRRRLEALQIIWELVNSRTNNAIEFIKQGHLVNEGFFKKIKKIMYIMSC